MRQFNNPAAAGVLTLALTLVSAGAWAQDKVTLRVWDSFTENSDGMDAMIAAFEAANPTNPASDTITVGMTLSHASLTNLREVVISGAGNAITLRR